MDFAEVPRVRVGQRSLERDRTLREGEDPTNTTGPVERCQDGERVIVCMCVCEKERVVCVCVLSVHVRVLVIKCFYLCD